MPSKMTCIVCRIVFIVHGCDSVSETAKCPHGHLLSHYNSRLDYDKHKVSINESELQDRKEVLPCT